MSDSQSANGPQTNVELRRPAPLPTSVNEMLALRRTASNKTLNDYVEELHIIAWEQDEYRNLLEAVYDEDAIEGSLAVDNVKAAEYLRTLARREEGRSPMVAGKKLATIVKALNVVLRRYHMSRYERAQTIGGQMMGENRPRGQDNNGF